MAALLLPGNAPAQTSDQQGSGANAPVSGELQAGKSSEEKSPRDELSPRNSPESASDAPEPAAAGKTPVLTKAPTILQQAEAAYPEQAAAEGIGGSVTLAVDLDESGNVTAAEVVTPAGHGFDEAAVEALRHFKFTPAELDGQKAAVRIEYVYVFSPPAEAPPPLLPEEDSAPEPIPVSLKGRAVERGSRRAVAGAVIRCETGDGGDCPEGQQETTGKDGAFELRLPPGDYVIGILSPEHETASHREKIAEGEILEVTYHLMPTPTGGFRTIVKGERERRDVTRRTVSREEIQSVPGAMGDAVRVIQNLPGVARSAYLGGQLSVRGAAPSETLSYMDGVEIPILFHFMGGPSVINPEFVEDIEFLPGGFGPRYGRATGGVINARTRSGSREGIHGNFKIDLVDAALFFEAPITEKFTIALSARRSYLDAILSNVTAKSDDFGTVSIVPRYWDYQLRLDYGRSSDRDRFTVMLFGSDDKLTASSSGGARALDIDLGAGIGFHRVTASWIRREGIFSNEMTASFGYDSADFDSAGLAEDAGSIEIDVTNFRVGLRDETSWDFLKKHKIRLGVDFAYDRSALSGEVPFSLEYRPLPGNSGLTEMTDISRTYDSVAVGLYHVWELNLFERLDVLPGIRADVLFANGNRKWAVDPRLNMRFRISDEMLVKGGVGHYSQAPSLFYMDKDFGNPKLGFTKAIQTSLGVERKFLHGITADVTGFFIYGYDRVASSDEIQQMEDGTLQATRYINATKSRNFGVEIMIKKDLSERLSGWIAYTLSKSQRKTPDDEHYRNSSYDQTHILAAVARYKFGRGWSLGARFRLVSGNPETPVKSSTFNADTDYYEPIMGEYYSERAPMFHQLDLRVDKEWIFKAWKLGVYLDIQNVYWADNTEYTIWDYRYRGSTGISGMPFFPTLGIKGSF